MARLDRDSVIDLDDRHGGGALEQLHHDALAGRVHVLDNDEGQAAGWRHVPQELFQGLQSPAEAPMPTMEKT